MIAEMIFIMADGTSKNGGFVSNTVLEYPVFNLEPDEHIVRLETKQGPSLSGLRIHTSKGRESLWYGGSDGESEDFRGSTDDPIVGFARAAEANSQKIIMIQRLRDPMAGVSAGASSPRRVLPAPPAQQPKPSVQVRINEIDVEFISARDFLCLALPRRLDEYSPVSWCSPVPGRWSRGSRSRRCGCGAGG